MTSVKKYLIIPAAGKATRLRPLSNNMSKAMVPINGKPLLQYILDFYQKYFDECIIVTNNDLNDIETYISRKNISNVRTVKQKETKGPLHAIDIGLNEITDDEFSFTVILGDTLVIYDNISKLINDDVLLVSKVNDYSRWCLINYSGNIVDKPKYNPNKSNPFDEYYALIGVYSFKQGHVAKKYSNDIINNDLPTVENEYQISQLLEKYGTDENYSDFKFKLIETDISNWYDFGTLKSYYENSARLLNRLSFTRPDSSLKFNFDSGTVIKQGSRCDNEIIWYNLVNSVNELRALKPNLPNIIESDLPNKTYTMEFITGSQISDMLLYDDLNEDSIQFIFDKVLKISNLFYRTKNLVKIPRETQIQVDFNMYGARTILGHQDKLVQKYIDNHIDDILSSAVWSYIHGDYHLGNILFDQMTSKIKIIDPRGIYLGKDESYYGIGDYLYDLSKLYQSIYGDYIWIYANEPVNIEVKEFALTLLNEYVSKLFTPDTIKAIKLRVPLLLLNAVPHHKENTLRQKKLYNKAMRLIEELQ